MKPEEPDEDAEPDPTVGSLLREIARAPEVSLPGPDEPEGGLGPGSRLGPYELIAPIGAGGMGQVFRARDERLGRDVAVKVLPRAYADSPDRRRRFEQEARATAAVDHPNLLAIHDAGTDEGIPYLVLELLEGETLRRRLERGPLGIRRAIELGAQLARGLAAAHARGITHRDLKPDNVFLTQGDRIKILDFGLAKAARPEDRAEGHASTASGAVMGTAGYMSPEQVRGEALDHRTDLFALGVILYEMIGGRRAFDGGSAVQTMNAILTEEPPPIAEVAPSTPPALDRIVHRCLAKDREGRYQSAHDLAFQLDGVVLAGAPAAAPSPRRWPWLAATAAAAVLAIVAYVAGRHRGEPAPVASPRTDTTAAVPAPAPPAEDRHWIQSDDYFISEQPWTQGGISVSLAKLKQPATASSRESLFFQLDSSRDVWTASYWVTRPAAPRELALGVLAVCFNDNVRDDVYRAPDTKDQARTGSWFLGKVTDTSDAPKGWIRIDTFNCALDAARVVRT